MSTNASKQSNKVVQLGIDGERGPPHPKRSELLNQFQKGLPYCFLQRLELVVPKCIAVLRGLIAGTLNVRPDDFRRNQKPARRFEHVLIEVCFLADSVHVSLVGESVALGRNPSREEHCGDRSAPVLTVWIVRCVIILEKIGERQRRLPFDKTPYGAGQGNSALRVCDLRTHFQVKRIRLPNFGDGGPIDGSPSLEN